jgi:4-hydroxybenzoate polyprenyltransferase
MGAAEAGMTGREGQTFAGGSLLSRYASFVKLPHTFFALPFAGVGALLASYEYADRVSVITIAWIVLAFTAARFAAMGFNRIVDRAYDAANPRTRMRELPTGRLSVVQAVVAVVMAAAVFVFSAWQLNPLCGWLSPVALSWILFYSYTKRFTSFSHYVLGVSLAIAPVGAYLAIAGVWSTSASGLLVLAVAVMLWVAGFDMVYAIQDVDFDRDHRLHSMPARVGPRRALFVARVMHIGAVTAFLCLLLFRLFPVGLFYGGGVVLMAALLVYEHHIVHDQKDGFLDLQRIDRAFFRMNVLVSTSFFAFTLLDRLFAS